MAGPVLVISPHPDDESLGCGGTIRKLVADGAEVRVLFLTSGEAGGHDLPADGVGSMRESEAVRACEILGAGEPAFWREPDGGLQPSDRLVDRLVTVIESSPPELLYVTHPQEDHADHRAAAALVKRAVTELAVSPRVLHYEVWTPLQRIDEIVDITDFIDDKMAAIRAHESQCAVLNFDAAFQGLARYRGEMHSWPGGPYAEVFARPEHR